MIRSLTLLAAVSVVSLGCQSSSPERRSQATQSLAHPHAGVFDVRAFGAKGDGEHLDSPAVNDAILAAEAAGGGTVVFPAGNYLCYSIRLKSNVNLHLGPGSTITAAEAKGIPGAPGYDAPEPAPDDRWQDFGHSHFQNSLIWGEDLENISISGPGLIHGKGLSDGFNKGRVINDPMKPKPAPSPAPKPATTATSRQPTQHDPRDTLVPTPGPWRYRPPAKNEYPNDHDSLRSGIGNKAISLKNCRNVTFRDFSILEGGHFGFLLTGCDTLTLDNIKIDTQRDGMDIDACRNVRVSNCSVNSPNDDGICLKSSFGLGYNKSCDDVTITNCYLTGGYRIGTMLNGKLERYGSGDRLARNGRIKFGTESNGGFKRITVSNCIMEYSMGLAIESVDGAIIQDVTINNIVMRDIALSPIFIRLGNRARGPGSPPPAPGVIRRVNISDIVCSNANWRFGSIITGIPGHPIEDLSLSNIRIQQQGGGTAIEAAIRPHELEANYPEPDMFGTMPASGFFIRHAKNLSMDHVTVRHVTPDARSLVWLEDVDGADLDFIRSDTPKTGTFAFKSARNLTTRDVHGLTDADNVSPADSDK